MEICIYIKKKKETKDNYFEIGWQPKETQLPFKISITDDRKLFSSIWLL